MRALACACLVFCNRRVCLTDCALANPAQWRLGALRVRVAFDERAVARGHRRCAWVGAGVARECGVVGCFGACARSVVDSKLVSCRVVRA